jgi:hypothetical protein
MSQKAVNVGVFVMATLGMVLTALGLLGVEPNNTAHHQAPNFTERHQ